MAWCISSQETTEVVKLLFEAIKDCSPNVKVRTLMTDDGKYHVMICKCLYCAYFLDDIWYNGSTAVLGNEIHHLLCHWHVDR